MVGLKREDAPNEIMRRTGITKVVWQISVAEVLMYPSFERELA